MEESGQGPQGFKKMQQSMLPSQYQEQLNFWD